MNERTCDQCGVVFTPTHSRNRYCDEHRGRRAAKLREYHDVGCVNCGKPFKAARSTGKLCSNSCRSTWYRQSGYGARQTVCHLSTDHPVRLLIRLNAAEMQPRSELRLAVEAGDRGRIFAAVRALCRVEGECWIWTRRLTDGYAATNLGKRKVAVHRLVLEVKHGKTLGKQAAHHICANTACVNPDHLQPVTHRENTAEMLARTYMEGRIADLEAALAALQPDHPLLSEIGLAC